MIRREKLAARISDLSGFAGRNRRILVPVTALLFFVAIVWAFAQLGLEPWQLQLRPFCILFFLLSPLSLIYGAQGLILLAMVADTPMRFMSALRSSAIGQLAEILPLPGGAMVRVGALVRAGTGAGRSTYLVMATAILWIALAATGAGIVLALDRKGIGLFLLIGGGVCSALILAAIWREAGTRLMLLTLFHRLIGLLLMAVRLSVAFAIVGNAVPLSATLPYVLAAIAGSAASIAPAGLGVSELMAAGMAHGLAASPAAALLAVALNRLVALASTALTIPLLEMPRWLQRVATHDC